LLLVQLSTK